MYTRLFVPVFFIIATVVAVRYGLLIGTESAGANARYQLEAQDLADYLAGTLTPSLATRDRAALDATLTGALLLDPDLSGAQLDYAGGHLEANRTRRAASASPPWFQRRSVLAPLTRTRLVGGAATLTLSFDPALPLNRVWATVRQQARISALNILIIYALLGAIIRVNQRMLRRLAQATDRFQHGEHQTRMRVGGTLEERALAATFNAMAAQVQSLVLSLQASEQRLGDQLAQTRHAKDQLRAEKEKIEVTLASIGDAVITTDLAGKIASINAAAQALTGWSEAEARGADLHRVFALANNFGQHALLKTMSAIYAGGEAVNLRNQSLRHRGGDKVMIEYTAAAIRDSGGQHGGGEALGSVLVFRDVSETRQLMQQMSWQSNHDILTGLPNRSALASRFEHEIALAREAGYPLAVCLFDLDHFQQINQTLGQELGNDILKQAAIRLHELAGRQHYVARLGGDEFVLLLPALAGHDAIGAAVTAVLARLALDYQCGPHTVSMSASAGVAVFNGTDVSADQLLRHADQALYQAKITGRNKYHLFDSDLDEQVRTHHNRRTEVRAALRDGELRLYYQPKLDMRKGRIIGMEALLRWQHPQRGVVGPMDFLPIVEHSDIIVDIGEWVLREALRQLLQWRALEPHWVVSVNIAARHFQRHDFVERLTAILAEFPDVPPHMLELEILESSALNDVGHVRAIMLACQALGISFALDDFGTGYSSMAYLKRLPADVLKIDQSFVRNMLVEREDLHLVSAVIGLAKAFGLRVIAEGVETVEHGALLMRLGCDLAQGYGIARPMPAAGVMDWAESFDSAHVWQAAALLPPIVDLRDAAPYTGAQLALFMQG
ncbi:EAL domain-containing protein [Rugamonas sp.]|uniref:putative bifunctional diguanylate cyclase/phosphodiesterase n=1 Tax=Rugamonas sp. TaxID=1926287 RepID=UPI0025D1F77D|nr:EAL domain-containing protein [Rugamonas sp.]